MPSNPTLPLTPTVDVTVSVSPVAAAVPTFNQGLIVGNSTVIPSYGANSRVQEFTSLTQMTLAGFANNAPEFLAAQMYFGANAGDPAPQTLWVGRQDTTAISTLIPHSGSAGTGYKVGDVVGITQGGATNGYATVLTVNAGVVETLGVVAGTQGTGYAVGTALATTGGSGTGLEVDITAIGESALQALTACRAVNGNWYSCMVCGAADSDHIAIAAYIQAATPPSLYWAATTTAAVATSTTGNVALTLQSEDYNRIALIYTDTAGGLNPNNIYAAAAAMGSAMGLNTGAAGSYFTMKFKQLTGIAAQTLQSPSPLTAGNYAACEQQGVNLYLPFTGGYTWFEQGVVSNGQFIDEIIQLDMLAADIQISVVDKFVSGASVPQTDPGEVTLENLVTQCCERAVTRGFLAPGIWEGVTILNLTAGTALPNGYLVQAQPFAVQSSANHQARQMMPIYVAVTEAGAGHSLSIAVNVQR